MRLHLAGKIKSFVKAEFVLLVTKWKLQRVMNLNQLEMNVVS